MISKILSVGDRIELSRVAAVEQINATDGKDNVYISQILEIIDEEKLKIGMPIHQGKVIPLAMNARLDACFYTDRGLYQGRLVVTDRYKEDSIFVLVVEVTSSLQKFQRRQYFRLGCVIDMKYRKINDEEVEEYAGNSEMIIVENDFIDATAIDISGGGVRFISSEKMEENQEVFMSIEISYDKQKKLYGLLGKVISSYEAKSRIGLFEHRVEFTNMQGHVREALIKYIFEEERRQRQKMLT